jgi:hypothetical protein
MLSVIDTIRSLCHQHGSDADLRLGHPRDEEGRDAPKPVPPSTRLVSERHQRLRSPRARTPSLRTPCSTPKLATLPFGQQKFDQRADTETNASKYNLLAHRQTNHPLTERPSMCTVPTCGNPWPIRPNQELHFNQSAYSSYVALSLF